MIGFSSGLLVSKILTLISDLIIKLALINAR
jgi:hypothetical protein